MLFYKSYCDNLEIDVNVSNCNADRQVNISRTFYVPRKKASISHIQDVLIRQIFWLLELLFLDFKYYFRENRILTDSYLLNGV